MFGGPLFVVLGTIFLQSTLVLSLEVTFRDSGYVTYTLPSPKRTDRDKVFLLFRTIKPSGLLLHAAGKEDFLTLELVRGKIRYTSYLGGRSSGVGYHEVLVGDNLADNKWHQVDVERRGMNLWVYVDTEKSFSNISGKHSSLDIEGKIYVAGLEGYVAKPSRDHRYFKFESFQGCLDDVTFNAVNILQLAYEKNSSTTVHGNVTYNCNYKPHYEPVTFPNPQAYVKVKTREMNATDYNFKFRTYEGDGRLLQQSLDKSNGAEISIRLESGAIRSDVIFNHPHTTVKQHVSQNFGDGLWHSLSLFIDHHRVHLSVDGNTAENNVAVTSFSSATEVTVGAGGRGSEKERLGFVGCMNDLVIQGKRVDFSKEQRTQALLHKCHLKDHCLPSPCKNRGVCIQKLNKTKCDCKATDFTGESCEVLAFEIANCAEWWDAGKRESKFYKINPSGTKPFVVYCDMSSEGNPRTVVQYKDIGRNITASNGQVINGSYEHSVAYNIGEKEIGAIVKSSTHCRQFLRYDCFNSVLFDSPKKFDYNGRGARWTSHSGKIQDYWGGAGPGSNSCACGESRTCSEHSRVCNCDIADKRWRSDEGYITNKSDLPVTSLRFSVSGTSHSSSYRLGNLECFGSTKPSTTADATSKGGTAVFTASNTPKSRTSTRTGSVVPTSSTSRTKFTHVEGGVSQRTTSELTEAASSKSSSSSTKTPDYDQGPIVIIETPRKYITIRETGHQQLVTIVLSIVLVVFICAIVVLLIRQNLLCPCKCLQMPACEGVNNIELGPSAPLYTQTDQSEIVKYETSPYHSKVDYDDVMVLRPGGSLTRWSPDMDSEAETDRLDISNGNSSDNSEMSAGLQKQNDTLEKQDAPDTFCPAELDLGTAGLTIMDVFSLSLAKELDNNVRKPGNKQTEYPKKYVPFSNRLKVQQRRRMSISDDESIVETVTSASDPNNSSDSIRSMNTRSWSDETVGDSENDEDIYRSDPTQRPLQPNGTLDNHSGSYEGSNEYLSREDQFVEISQHTADRGPWVRNAVNHSSDRRMHSVKGGRSARKNAARGKCEAQESDRQHSPWCREEHKNIVEPKLQNGRISGNGIKQNSKAYHLNLSNEREKSLKNCFDEKIHFVTTRGSGHSSANGLKTDHIVFMELAEQRQAHGRRGQTLSNDDLSENSDKIRSHETEL